MIKKIIFSFVTICSISISSFAEEGMLIPSLISAFESEMQAMGMKLTAKDIYDVNHSSLKDAIIHFYNIFRESYSAGYISIFLSSINLVSKSRKTHKI